jgi:hypothetical protein
MAMLARGQSQGTRLRQKPLQKLLQPEGCTQQTLQQHQQQQQQEGFSHQLSRKLAAM